MAGFGGIGFCCCGPGCDINLIDFNDSTFGSLPNSGTTGWVIDTGRLEPASDDGSARGLLWTVPIHDVPQRTIYRISADTLGISHGVEIIGADWEVYLWLDDDGKLNITFTDDQTDGSTQGFTSDDSVPSPQTLNELILVVTGDCQGRASIYGRSGEVALGPYRPYIDVEPYAATTIQMGVFLTASAGSGGENDPCCDGFNRKDSYTIDETYITAEGNYTALGTLNWDDANSWWIGDIVWNACGEEYIEENVKIVCNGSGDYVLNGTFTATSVDCNAGVIEFGGIALPLLCLHEETPANITYIFTGTGGGFDGERAFDDVQMQACTGVEPPECDINPPCCWGNDCGVIASEYELVVPASDLPSELEGTFRLKYQTPSEMVSQCGTGTTCGSYSDPLGAANCANISGWALLCVDEDYHLAGHVYRDGAFYGSILYIAFADNGDIVCPDEFGENGTITFNYIDSGFDGPTPLVLDIIV